MDDWNILEKDGDCNSYVIKPNELQEFYRWLNYKVLKPIIPWDGPDFLSKRVYNIKFKEWTEM